jgi:hypothetical protein
LVCYSIKTQQCHDPHGVHDDGGEELCFVRFSLFSLRRKAIKTKIQNQRFINSLHSIGGIIEL